MSPRPEPPVSAVPVAAYLHIPFCRRRCYYCDFAVSIVGDRPPLPSPSSPAAPDGHGSRAIATYIETLCQEIEATSSGPPLETIFFGGGTPSLLSSQQLGQVLHTLKTRFGIAPGAEISMEVDPDTVKGDMLVRYQELGVNRVSLGVQAFQDQLLAACGRTHRRHHIDRALQRLQDAGLTNISLDLISGLPQQTLAQWSESLEMAIATGVPHLSVYDLIVEPRTAFSRWYRPGEAPLPSEAVTAQMYREAQARLTQAGYQHYEVSNYAKPGFQCRHNRIYWHNQPFYGFGMGAASYQQQHRLTRPRTQAEYRQWVQAFAASGTGALDSATPDSPTEQLLDTLMLGLRLAEGLSLNRLAQQFGHKAVQEIISALSPFQQKGWVLYSPPDTPSKITSPLQQSQYRVRLSDPEGFLFSNVVLSALFEALSDE